MTNMIWVIWYDSYLMGKDCTWSFFLACFLEMYWVASPALYFFFIPFFFPWTILFYLLKNKFETSLFLCKNTRERGTVYKNRESIIWFEHPYLACMRRVYTHKYEDALSILSYLQPYFYRRNIFVNYSVVNTGLTFCVDG